jgi:hypothetical protein
MVNRFRDWLRNGEWPEAEKIAAVIALTLLALVLACTVWIVTLAIIHLANVFSSTPL